MYVSPHEPETTSPTTVRGEPQGDEDGSTTLRASPAEPSDQSQDEPLDEPGYGHGV